MNAAADVATHTGLSLKRRLGPVSVTLYGLGTTIGAGIYVLLGKVAAEAGGAALFAFLVAALVATPSAFAFAFLSRQFPRSGGEAIYVREAFRSVWFSTLVGIVVVLAGTVSGATLVTGFVGYLGAVVSVPQTATIIAVCLVLAGVAIWGIKESVTLAATLTVIEIAGLLAIVISAQDHLADLPVRWMELIPEVSVDATLAIAAGSILAFYAFIGFEDIVNLAEETRDPKRAIPLAIASTLVLTALLYGVLAVVAVLVMDIDSLSRSTAPLADLFAATTNFGPLAVALIGMVAVINGALVQLVKGSRVLYGLSKSGAIPSFFGALHPRFGTPVYATAIIGTVLCILALLIPLSDLAKITSFLTLMVFACVNASLLIVVARGPAADIPRGVGWIVGTLGLLASLSLAGFQLVDAVLV